MVSSTPTRRQRVAVRIVDRMRADVPALLDDMVRRICAEVPVYGDVVPAADLRTSLGDNIDYVFEVLAGTRPDRRAPERTGRARAAQGAPLVEMLGAYRIGFSMLWGALVAAARALPDVPDDAIVDLAGELFAVQNDYSDAATAAYREEALQMLRARERERAVLVESILTGAAAKGTLWEAAAALRLPLDGVFLVVAARAQLGHDPMPRLESTLAVYDISSVWRLETDLSLGVLSLPDRTRAPLVLETIDRHAGGPVGVSPVFAELRQAPWALRLARLALDHRGATKGAEQFRDRPLNVLLAAAPHAALETARAVLGELLDLPPADRDLLLVTFDAWVEAGGSAQDAGAALYCHANTVRYRLRRFETVTGRDLGRPGDLAELVAAARAWSHLPHSTSS